MQYVNTLLDMPVIDFNKYKDTFTWDFFLHTPVVTSKFVSGKFGIDLVAFSGSEIQANKMLTTIAKTAKDYIFARLPMRSRDYQEFRLSREIDLLNNYLEYQCAFVIAAVNTGSVYEIYNMVKYETKQYNAGLESAASLVATKFRTRGYERIPERLLRVGY